MASLFGGYFPSGDVGGCKTQIHRGGLNRITTILISRAESVIGVRVTYAPVQDALQIISFSARPTG